MNTQVQTVETSPSASASPSAPELEIKFPPYFEEYVRPARYKGLYGGRGSGKSHSFAGYAILRMANEPGLRIVCVREVQRSIADSVKQLLEDKIATFHLGSFFTITENEIVGENGSRCIFRGMQNHTAASIKSLEGFDVAWVEEAQTISQKSLDLLTPTIRKKGSELWFSWNPENEDDPVDVLLRQDPPPGSIVNLVNHSENPWFPDELRDDMERDRERDPDKFAHVWEGEYRGMSEARIFRNFREGELTPPDNVIWFYGADWGFANDETAGLRCCFPDSETIYVDHEVYELGIPTESLPHLFNKLPDATKWPMRGDSARPEAIDHMRRHGFPKIRKARKGQGSVEDGIMFLQGFEIVVDPRCPNLLRELKSYAYKTDPRTGEILPVVEDKNNHLIDALRYAVEGLHKRGRLIPAMLKPEPELLQRPRDYQRGRQTAESWKVA